MNKNPLAVALREIAETKSLLDLLITSSETFDYPQAKIALHKLQQKTRELAKLQQQLTELQKVYEPDLHLLNFTKPPAPEDVRDF